MDGVSAVNGGITMIKREITETVYEYDGEGKLVSKRITETKEEEDGNNPSWTIPITTNPVITTIPTLNDSICESHNITCCKKQD